MVQRAYSARFVLSTMEGKAPELACYHILESEWEAV